ncbi:hypothetical protein EDC01DRAFT_774763 [Geopyxis carbonaria]|nr:hypothetical protein EDC01DRAFT_774763 [Geopyxis carbonaria]
MPTFEEYIPALDDDLPHLSRRDRLCAEMPPWVWAAAAALLLTIIGWLCLFPEVLCALAEMRGIREIVKGLRGY